MKRLPHVFNEGTLLLALLFLLPVVVVSLGFWTIARLTERKGKP